MNAFPSLPACIWGVSPELLVEASDLRRVMAARGGCGGRACECLCWTFVSAFAVLCGARTDLPDRHVCCVFWLNVAAALIQVLTAIVMVGWIMSIFWGMDMVILAIILDTQEPRVWILERTSRTSLTMSSMRKQRPREVKMGTPSLPHFPSP
nr:protein stum homolog isoform X2 [Equus asinus]